MLSYIPFMISSTKTSFSSLPAYEMEGANWDGRSFKWNYNKKKLLVLCCEIRKKTERKNVRKSYYIHTQFFNILFQFFILLKTFFVIAVCLRQQSASWSLFQVGRDVDVTVSFLLFFFLRLRSFFYDLRNKKLFSCIFLS